jgi:hypothetical protein
MDGYIHVCVCKLLQTSWINVAREYLAIMCWASASIRRNKEVATIEETLAIILGIVEWTIHYVCTCIVYFLVSVWHERVILN